MAQVIGTADCVTVKELCIFITCCVLFLGYHLWLFVLRPLGLQPFHRKSYFDIYSASHKSRGVWAEEVLDDTRDALQTYGIQTLRNAITAASFLATACSLIAVQGILRALLDQGSIDRLDSLSAHDPILKGPGLFDSTTKLCLGEIMILGSFLAFAQSIRMMNHLGFYLRVVPSKKRNVHGSFRNEEAIAMSLRAATTFTIGFRLFYAFIPLLLWLFGPTALLCSTVLEVIMLWLTDTIKRAPVTAMEEDIEAGREASAGAKQPQQQELQHVRGQGQGQEATQEQMGPTNGRGRDRGREGAAVHGSTAAVFVL